MPHFRYRAIGRDGKPRQSVVEANDMEDARNRITGRGWTIEWVAPATLSIKKSPPPPPPRRSKAPLILAIIALIAALAALVWFDPYGWFADLPIPQL